MSNHGWISVDDQPLPNGRNVLVLFENPVHGMRFAIRISMKISNGYLAFINGIMEWDEPEKIVAWRSLDDIEDSIPLAFA